MKNKKLTRMLALALATVMSLTACGNAADEKTSGKTSESKTSESAVSTETLESEEKPVNKEDLPVITFYPKSANLASGPVTGFRSDLFAEYGFQVEVWAYSEDKTNAMLASGDLPDIIQVANKTLSEALIKGGKVISYDDYKEYLPNLYENPTEFWLENAEYSRENFSYGTGKLYYLPNRDGNKIYKWRSLNAFDRNIVKLKWDVYESIGAPEIKDYWDLIDVMEEMLKAQPTAEDGTKMYGTFLDNGEDGKFFGAMQLWYHWQGYNQNIYQYFVEGKHSDGVLSSILTEDSKYYEGLKWYNEVYRRGLMDPDSISTSRKEQAPKLDAGYAMVPSGTLPGNAPKYFEYFIPGAEVFIELEDERAVWESGYLINAETEHLEECLAFINAAADPMFFLESIYGPEGDIWQCEGNVVTLTDRFKDWLKEKGAINFYPMSDGTEWSNWTHGLIGCQAANELIGYVGADGKPVCLNPTTWPDAKEIIEASENYDAWKKTMGADDLWDYAEKNNIKVYTDSLFTNIISPTPTDAQKLQIASIKEGVVTQSWKCVYAETDAEFDAAWKKLVDDAMGLGAQEIIDWAIQGYKEAIAARP